MLKRLLPVLCLVMTACDVIPSLGFSLDSSGAVILVPLCPGEVVQSVALVESGDQIVGDEDDVVIWRITSPDGSVVDNYVVGETPEGFVEDTPMTGETPDLLVVEVQTSLAVLVDEAEMAELADGRVLVKGDRFDSWDEALEEINPGCPDE